MFSEFEMIVHDFEILFDDLNMFFEWIKQQSDSFCSFKNPVGEKIGTYKDKGGGGRRPPPPFVGAAAKGRRSYFAGLNDRQGLLNEQK